MEASLLIEVGASFATIEASDGTIIEGDTTEANASVATSD